MFVNWWDNPTKPDLWHKHQVRPWRPCGEVDGHAQQRAVLHPAPLGGARLASARGSRTICCGSCA